MSERTKAAIDISARYKFVHPSHANLQEMKGVIRVLTAHGWPRLALWSGYEIGYGGDGPSSKPRGYWTIWSGMRISGTQHDYSVGLNAVPRSLPYRPIWSGFAINTLFYAAILWILWSSSSAARRLIRRKRGLCIKCGYDLRGNSGGDVCPECGITITAPN
ncbi:MAG: hypothetical protein IH984_03575 [Planctomycetes bacterium]|nr:hypothetical protein [Planctomycetota bacterium]